MHFKMGLCAVLAACCLLFASATIAQAELYDDFQGDSKLDNWSFSSVYAASSSAEVSEEQLKLVFQSSTESGTSGLYASLAKAPENVWGLISDVTAFDRQGEGEAGIFIGGTTTDGSTATHFITVVPDQEEIWWGYYEVGSEGEAIEESLKSASLGSRGMTFSVGMIYNDEGSVWGLKFPGEEWQFQTITHEHRLEKLEFLDLRIVGPGGCTALFDNVRAITYD